MLDYRTIIKDRRKELGWTVEKVASEAGITPFTITRIEQVSPKYASAQPRFDTVEKILNGMGLYLVVDELKED